MAVDRYFRTGVCTYPEPLDFDQFNFSFFKSSTAQTTVSKVVRVFTKAIPADPGHISLVGTHITQ